MTQHDYKILVQAQEHYANILRCEELAETYLNELTDKCDHVLPSGESAIGESAIAELPFAWCSICRTTVIKKRRKDERDKPCVGEPS
jgi:hypothetical protein